MVGYIEAGESRLGLTLADVSGKGLGAALLMAKLQATQRALYDSLGTLSAAVLETKRWIRVRS